MAHPQPVFSVEEANALVPFLKERFSAIRRLQEQLRGAREDMKVLSDIWGKALLDSGNADNKLYRAAKERMDEAAQAIAKEVGQVTGKGCTVTDLNEALVDFPHSMGGAMVLLCWRFPEDKVAFWHETSAGFAGRRPLEQLQVRA